MISSPFLLKPRSGDRRRALVPLPTNVQAGDRAAAAAEAQTPLPKKKKSRKDGCRDKDESWRLNTTHSSNAIQTKHVDT